MKKIVFASFIISCVWFVTHGAVLQEISTHRARPELSNELGFSSETLSLNSLSTFARLGPSSSFRQINGNLHKSAKGIKRIRLVQTYGGYDVYGSGAEAEMDANDRFSGQMYGEVAKNLEKDIPNPEACQRRVKNLQNRAIRLSGINPADVNIDKKDARRIIYVGPKTLRARLAYRISFFYANEMDIRYPVYFFDACTGFVLLSYNKIKNGSLPILGSKNRLQQSLEKIQETVRNILGVTATCSVPAEGIGGNQKIGQTTYNNPPFCLDVQKNGNTCRMEGTYSRVIDNENTFRRNKQTVVEFPCSSGYSDGVNGAFGVASDAFYYGEIAGSFFEDKYGIRALNYKPRIVIHYGFQYENAIWDGTDMFFGDGGSIFYPFSVLDVISHELAHGITTSNSDLIYSGQSGGINEAFSDITGETTKFFARNSNNWYVGYDVMKPPYVALRYFENPPDDGRSIKYSFQYRPFMDVHFSSGVFNHAFYAMVQIERMDIYDAFKCFLDANLNLWRPNTNYFSGACNVMQAAYDNGFSHRKVRRAFWRVGIPLIFCRYAALSTSMFVGETRKDILVRAARTPIIKLEFNEQILNSTLIEIQAPDNSNVHVDVGKDDEVTEIIASGKNRISFSNSRTHVYIKLSSGSSSDVKVTMKTSA